MRESFDKIINILRTLRGKDGCAWDKEQTIESFAPYIMSEAKEIEAAVQRKDYEELKAELGDLFYNVLHLAAIAEEQGHFKMADVLKQVHEKMIRRHPHVFGSPEERTTDVKKIVKRWGEIKEEERRGKGR